MESLRAALGDFPKTWPKANGAQIAALALQLRLPDPVSVAAIIGRLRALPSQQTWTEQISTPAGTALGGHVELIAGSDGSWRFKGHMRGSGFDSYAFRIVATLRGADDEILLAAQHSGKVGGTTGGGSRDDDWDEHGAANDEHRRVIQNIWPRVANAKLTVVHEYSDTGLLGTVTDAFETVASFVATKAILGLPVATALLIGSELRKVTGSTHGGFGQIAGVVVTGGVALLSSGTLVYPAIVAGVAAGALVDEMIDHDLLSEEQAAFAERVFKGTLPPREQIMLTNLSGIDDRPFTWPAPDGGVLVNLGKEGFESPLGYEGGGLLIHELVHAWQIHHRQLIVDMACRSIREHLVDEPLHGKKALYDPKPPGRPWREYSLEQQASAVEQWFKDGMSQSSPWFTYVARHIWTGIVV